MGGSTFIKCLFVALALSPFATEAVAQKLYGDLVLRPLPDGVHMETINAIGFWDKKGRQWEVRPGYQTDGASIPRALWSIVGSPYTGKYLPAAIIHDFYCDLRSREWEDVHRVFLEAMLANGVDSTQAKIMYYAVYRFGPRWVFDKRIAAHCPTGLVCKLGPPERIVKWTVVPIVDEEEFSRVRDKIVEEKWSFDRIEEESDRALLSSGTLKHSWDYGKKVRVIHLEHGKKDILQQYDKRHDWTGPFKDPEERGWFKS